MQAPVPPGIDADAGDDVRFDDASLFAHVSLASGLVPAKIAGTISGDAVEEEAPLAIAVNGRVRAMTRAYELGGGSGFEAMVPETSFHDGRNDVEIYAVSRSKRAFHFVLLGGTSPPNGRVVAAAGPPTSRPEGHGTP